jgi:hypothetical protein
MKKGCKGGMGASQNQLNSDKGLSSIEILIILIITIRMTYHQVRIIMPSNG